MIIRQIIIVLLLLLPLYVHAQQISFQTFLSEHEKSEHLDSISFGKAFNFIEHEERYALFLPQINDTCPCKKENVNWQKGSYIQYKNFIAVMLQRYCSNYQDGNDKWFMENDGTDYVLITYSYNGEILDYKIIGHTGIAYTIHLETLKNNQGFVVKQGIVTDCSLLRQYKDVVYQIRTHEYILQSNGKIKERYIGAPYKEVVDILSSVKQFSFQQFLSYFQKWDNTTVDHVLFTPSREQIELPFKSCLTLLPDTLDINCWPRDIQWIPCRYIENKESFSFFIIKNCMTPKSGFYPYTDYLILEFSKNGMFRNAKNIYHLDDNTFINNTITQDSITIHLQNFYHSNMEVISRPK